LDFELLTLMDLISGLSRIPGLIPGGMIDHWANLGLSAEPGLG
jgi:hypothetical protein